MNPLVTVVVSTLRRPTQLRACLYGLAYQKLSLSQFEVIVLDEADDAETASLVRTVSQETGLQTRYLRHARRRGMSSPHNRGWRLATSLFVAFTHDNCVPHPLWLTTALPLFGQGAQVVVGRVQYALPTYAGAAATTLSANLFCRRATLTELNGLNEARMDTTGPEAWLQSLARQGIRVTPCPEAVVVVQVEPLSWYTKIGHSLRRLLRT